MSVYAAAIELTVTSDPGLLAERVRTGKRPLRIQFQEPLPDELMSALASVLVDHPELAVRVWGGDGRSPDLTWLSPLAHLEHLSIERYGVTSFDALASFTRLRSLTLRATKSTRPSLSFLRQLPHLENLTIERHAQAAATSSSSRADDCDAERAQRPPDTGGVHHGSGRHPRSPATRRPTGPSRT